MLKRAQEKKTIKIHIHNLREYSKNKQKSIDDYQFGGGAGMVLQAQPLIDATRYAKSKLKSYKCIYLSPKGIKVTQEMIVNTADNDNLIIIAGRYEGVDQRFIDLEVDEEWSIGDYILSGGEVAACVIIDAVSRMIPGVLGHEESNKEEFDAAKDEQKEKEQIEAAKVETTEEKQKEPSDEESSDEESSDEESSDDDDEEQCNEVLDVTLRQLICAAGRILKLRKDDDSSDEESSDDESSDEDSSNSNDATTEAPTETTPASEPSDTSSEENSPNDSSSPEASETSSSPEETEVAPPVPEPKPGQVVEPDVDPGLPTTNQDSNVALKTMVTNLEDKKVGF